MTLDTIQLAARASSAAYLADPAPTFRELGFDRVRTGDGWIVAANQDRILVAFRGSHNLHDWFIDLDAIFTSSPYCHGKVHLGFANAYNNINGAVVAAIDELYQHSQSFLITGHSLGGAIAALFSLSFDVRCWTLDVGCSRSLITFGQPRVGNAEFSRDAAATLDATQVAYHRIVNTRDIVPRVPLIQGRHFGQPHILDNLGMRNQITFGEKLAQDAAAIYKIGKFVASRAAAAMSPSAAGLIGIDDLAKLLLHEHSMALYLDRLSRLAVSQTSNFKSEIPTTT
jgi:pimeloyl-ACP methyl ester carboxylesterase